MKKRKLIKNNAAILINNTKRKKKVNLIASTKLRPMTDTQVYKKTIESKVNLDLSNSQEPVLVSYKIPSSPLVIANGKYEINKPYLELSNLSKSSVRSRMSYIPGNFYVGMNSSSMIYNKHNTMLFNAL